MSRGQRPGLGASDFGVTAGVVAFGRSRAKVIVQGIAGGPTSTTASLHERIDRLGVRGRGVASDVHRDKTWFVLDEDMRRVVDEQRLGFVATVCADGSPNLSPKGTLAVFDDKTLVFAHLYSHQTVANIEAGNGSVEVNVVDPIRRKGYRFKGTATVHRAGTAEFDDGVRFYHDRSGLARDRIVAIVLIRVENAAPVVSPVYDDGSTEEQVEQRSLERFGLERRQDDNAPTSSARRCDHDETAWRDP